ncbi:MAG: DUF1634 domain-containing protein [Acidobacteria bacterium]|nr:DUF1634 domain-containing protein [Acidobacteriota bacterium]
MKTPWTDQKIEEVVGNLLRTGVMLSAVVVLFGGIIYLARHGTEPADYGVFHGEPEELRTVGGIVRYAFSFHGRGIIQLGLLLLIATPVARVAFAVWGFAAERDRLYVFFTVVVLLILLGSLIGSSAGV